MSTGHGQSHEKLGSLLTEQNLPLPLEVSASLNSAVFEFDPERSTEQVFPQSVASGSPTPTGVILWTRINPAVYEPEQSLAVEVAADREFTEHVYRGSIEDTDCIANRDHTVKINLDGTLDPDQEYYYRFIYNGVRSQVGQCRTLPDPDSSPESVRFALVTCQDYQNGYYGAYHHIASEDVDFLVHMGDFIYDSAASQYKGLGSHEYPDREITLPSGHDKAWTLDDYRQLYKIYKSDEFLQEALERHTMIATHDDHEIACDVYWDDATDAPSADHPKGDDPEFMTHLTADALRAWWEYLPVRIGYDPEADAFHERFRFWRRFQFGDLVDLLMTEGRLFRDEPWTGDIVSSWRSAPMEEEPLDRTMFGENQLSWFLQQIRQSETMWNVWIDEVLTVPIQLGASRATIYPVTTGWDGFMRERHQIMTKLSQWDVSNFITFTGDMHCYLAGYQQATYPDALSNLGTSEATETNRRVGVELMTPPLTSLNIAEEIGANRRPFTDVTETLLSRVVCAQNPHIEFFNSHHWGYAVAEFTPDGCTHTTYSVDKTVEPSNADKEVISTLRVPEGRVTIEEITEHP
jgi:alkaline phosphatase D